MKGYETKNASAWRKQVRKTHSNAKLAGVLYLLGSLAMAIFACLPMLSINGTALWAGNFYEPILKIFKTKLGVRVIATTILYAIVVIGGIVNFLRALKMIGPLTKNTLRYANNYNRNARAMEEIGERFSDSFATIINLHFLIYILQPSGTEVVFSFYAYAMLAIGFIVHFVAGIIGGQVSFFHVNGQFGSIEEEKRTCGIWVYLFRNAVQVVATVAIMYFFVPVCTLNRSVELVPFILQILLIIWIVMLVEHTTATTEFNYLGSEGAGMKKYRIFSFLVVLTAGGVIGLEYLAKKTFTDVATSYAIIAGVAFVAFFLDCIFKSDPQDEEMEDTDEQSTQPFMPYPANVNAQGQPRAPYAPMKNGSSTYQPVYIPVYYPYSQNDGAPFMRPVCAPTPAPTSPYANDALSVENRPAPSPAPAHLQPKKVATNGAETKPLSKLDSINEVHKLDLNKEWRVRCPQCGKELMVSERTPYHRCPSCSKIFQIKKFETFVKKS